MSQNPKRRGFGTIEISENRRFEDREGESYHGHNKKKRKKHRKKGAAQLQKMIDSKNAQESAEQKKKEYWASAMSDKGRDYTLSVALPGSIVDNAQSPILRTYLVGQIARAATIFHVDEIVVFDDGLGKRSGPESGHIRGRGGAGGRRRSGTDGGGSEGGGGGGHGQSEAHLFLARVLQYLETPQYLRKALFPQHPDLRFAGLLNPLDAPHHMRRDDACPFREGVTLDRPTKAGEGSLVDCGLPQELLLDRRLKPGVRVTVELDPETSTKRVPRGRAAAPSAPRERAGLYWGYAVRLAGSLGDVFAECPFPEGEYDLTVGTSERGACSLEDAGFALPPFKRALLVLGGVHGLEAAVDQDENLKVAAQDTGKLFDLWANVCPGQGSRTIRTEEALPIALARLLPLVRAAGGKGAPGSGGTAADTASVGGDS